jgi:hypothetical protein
MEFRQFFSKVGVQPGATASSYIETQQTTTSRVDGDIARATKLSCAIYGPMQRQNDVSGAGVESCAIKVIIEFADIMRSDQILMEQFPDLEEDLKMQTDLIGT